MAIHVRKHIINTVAFGDENDPEKVGMHFVRQEQKLRCINNIAMISIRNPLRRVRLIARRDKSKARKHETRRERRFTGSMGDGRAHSVVP